jgi:cell division septal protein FtsQ
MHDLRMKKSKDVPRNRLKKQRRPPVNYRSFFKKGARLVGGFIAITLIGVVSFEIYGLLARTTFLRLTQIEVGSLKRLTRDEVIALAGVKAGDDMLAIRLTRIGEQLAKNPWIEKVQVRRYFPHTLTIDITEREPVAVVNMGYLYYLDAKGDIFKPLTEGDRLDFPLLTGFSEEEMARDPDSFRQGVKASLELMGLLKERAPFTLADVSEIHYGKGYGFTLFTVQGGVPVRLGSGNFSDKLGRLARIYPDLRAQLLNLHYIDLDYNDKIIVKKT